MGRKIELKFPLTNGGKETGFNDSGIETFLGRPHYYIARECGQNVGDVALKEDNIVKLQFELMQIPVNDIPCMDQLQNAIKKSYDFIQDPKGKKFFKRALESMTKNNLSVLKISDYGTTGLLGDDDDRNGGWYGLVRSEGVTNKHDGNKGGGFGIGKFATFAGSGLRTVFYSTKTKNGEVGFQGVSHLVSHPNGKHITQGTGYIGYYNEDELNFSAIREESLIPQIFRREEIGLDIYVLDFMFDKDWEKSLIKSILENFWPAIHFEKIEFVVSNQLINKDSLSSLMKQFVDDQEFEAYYHYQCVVSSLAIRFKEDLKYLGQVELYLLKGWNDNFPRSIARVRKSGMVIDKKNTRARVPYSGLFRCIDSKGNELLKLMEPPKHDKFEHDRAGEEGRLALNYLDRWLAKHVQELNPKLSSKQIDIPDLYKYLPDTSDEDTELDESGLNKNDGESFDLSTKNEPPMMSKLAQIVVHTTNVPSQENGGASGSGEKEENKNEESSEGQSSGQGEGKGAGTNMGDNSGPNPNGKNSYTTIKSRTIQTKDLYYPILLLLKPNNDFKGKLVISAVGEDGTNTPVPVRKASIDDATKTTLTIADGVIVSEIHLKSGKTTKLKLELEVSQKVAIKVTGKSA